jgi:peptidoglycan-associated lipoprotein
LFSACTSAPPATDTGDGPVVTRTAANTVWATPEAVAAAQEAARSAAAERDARVRAEAAARRSPPAAAADKPQASTTAPAGTAGATAEVSPSAPGTGGQAIGPGTMAVEPLQRVVYFDYDSFALRAEAQPMVERRARALLNQPQARLLLEGHADERGGSEYNLALGQKRAEAVLRALVVVGVPEARLEATSFGSTRPAVEGRDENAWSQNRRVEIKER